MTRGLRNNNPGNIRKSRDRWIGLAEKQTDEDFFVFKAPEYGIRAILVSLHTKADRLTHEGSDFTLEAAIKAWAPPSENDTGKYVQTVAAWAGLRADEPLDGHDPEMLLKLAKGIIRYENGTQPYGDDVLRKALRLSGFGTAKPLGESRTLKGSQVAGAAIGTTGLVDGALEFKNQIQPYWDGISGLVGTLEGAKWILLGIALLGIGLVVWARVEDHLREVR